MLSKIKIFVDPMLLIVNIRELGCEMYYHPRQNILHKINEILNETYVLKYAFELGKSERIIDQSVSTYRLKIKLLKSYLAIILHSLLRSVMTKGNHLTTFE